MERNNLIQKLNKLELEMEPLLERHAIYSGLRDLVSGEVLHPNEIDPRNVNLRELTQALADVYEKAVQYVTIAGLYFELNNEKGSSKIRENMRIYSKLILYSKRQINVAISKLPN